MPYYLAFFLSYPPFLEKKLQVFPRKNKSKHVFLKHDNIDKFFSSLDDLPEEVSPPEQWYLHGSHLNETIKQGIPQLPLLNGTCLEEIDNIFSFFAANYSWVIFPWGSVYSYELMSSFGFISQEKEKFDKFINSCSNTMAIKSRLDNVATQQNCLISTYEIKTSFQDHVQGILIDENFDYPGSLIWDALNLDACHPLFISEVHCGYENSFYDEFSPDYESGIYWERANYKPLTIIDMSTEKNYFKLGVCESVDKQSFINMCRSYEQGTEVLLVVSQSTNLDKLTKLLPKLENPDYSNLSYLQEILEATEWFYGLNRNFVGWGDYTYSLFVARNNQSIIDINKSSLLDTDKLVCFF